MLTRKLVCDDDVAWENRGVRAHGLSFAQRQR
jgi:hypothetical protein